MKASFITTVYNEENSILPFLKSLKQQTRLPDEVVIVDGGSSDKTWEILQDFEFPPQIKVKLIKKKGNRSVGRNEAIKNSTGDVISCSDAGCILDKNWLKEILKPFKDVGTEVVAGYYKGVVKSAFQECLIPYVLVMPERLNPDNFLPATRSMAFRKSAWKKIGGFQENLSHNEDYVFSRKLQDRKVRMVFQKKAIVNWIPRRNLKDAFIMFFRFAYGDIEARIIRPKVALIFIRYLIVFFLLVWFLKSGNTFPLEIILLLTLTYFIWILFKNSKYIKKPIAMILFPIIQITSDFAVLLGSLAAVVKMI